MADELRPVDAGLLRVACGPEGLQGWLVPPPVLGKEEEEGRAATGLTVPLYPQGWDRPVSALSLGCGVVELPSGSALQSWVQGWKKGVRGHPCHRADRMGPGMLLCGEGQPAGRGQRSWALL